MFDLYVTKEACNIYLIGNSKEAILIDPGYNKNNCLLEHIKKLGVKVSYVLLTHCHYDHIEALEDILKVFPKAVTYISKDDEIGLTDPRFNLTIIREVSGGKSISYRPKNLVIVNDNDELNLLGYSIKVIATPFHTRGSVCYYFKNENILFSGDTLFFSSVGRCDLPGGEERKMKGSLRKLINLPDETVVYPGHGVKTTIAREKKYNSFVKNVKIFV